MSLKEDFYLWKKHYISELVFRELETREGQLVESLVQSAGVDPLEDRFRAGYIAAVRDFTRMSADDMEE